MFEKLDSSKRKDMRPYPEEVLNMLADNISNRLRVATPEEKIKDDLFLKVSNQVFSENEVEEDFWPILRSQIGKILNSRKPKIPITKLEKKRMISGAEKLVEEKKSMGIDENGDLMEDF